MGRGIPRARSDRREDQRQGSGVEGQRYVNGLYPAARLPAERTQACDRREAMPGSQAISLPMLRAAMCGWWRTGFARRCGRPPAWAGSTAGSRSPWADLRIPELRDDAAFLNRPGAAKGDLSQFPSGGCGQLSGLWLRHLRPLALMASANQVPLANSKLTQHLGCPGLRPRPDRPTSAGHLFTDWRARH